MANRRQKSTFNPFDSEDEAEGDETSSDVFHDCHESHTAAAISNANGGNRRAQLNFQSDYNTNPFVSPLEQALNEVAGPTGNYEDNLAAELDSSIESDADDFELNEESPLLSTKVIPDEIYSVNPQDAPDNFDYAGGSRKNKLSLNTRLSTVGKNPRKKESTTSRQTSKSLLSNAAPSTRPLVLKELSSRQQDPDLTKDYKMTRLEDLGTASSWLILLLPYFAFAICLLLESDSSFKVTKWGPAGGKAFCFGKRGETVPILPTPPGPCIYEFNKLSSWQGSLLEIEQDMAAYGMRNSTHKGSSISRGTAFESGVITTVPPSADVFYADATFTNLTTEAVALVERGAVSVSALLFQRQDHPESPGKDVEDWGLVATSRPERLSMACHLQGGDPSAPSWVCNTPRITEILFAMPGSAVLTGHDLRVNILFANTEVPEAHGTDSKRSYVYVNEKLYRLLDSVDLSYADLEGVLVDIVQASEFTITHTNPVATAIDIGGRLIALLTTIAFTAFWLSKLGLGCCGFGLCNSCRKRDDLYEIRRVMSLLDSPWVMFPERWYILLLLAFLILIQGPLLVVMYFSPKLSNNSTLHTAADTMVGVGVNGVLLVYTCLFDGLKYHTAYVTRKWMEYHRNLTEIRRAAKYVVAGSEESGELSEESILRYTAEYFERHGDTDGISSIVNLRLNHDPLSAYWADFFLPKLFIFIVGVSSIWLTAFTRFHFSDSSVSAERLLVANAVYLASYAVQFVVLFLWLIHIFRSSMETGSRLRVQPFLSTRSAQLAYRVIFAHVTLGFSALVVSFLLGLAHLLRKWEGVDSEEEKQSFGTVSNQVPQSSIDFWMQVLTRVMQRFPYSGTAMSLGLGRVFFATVSILIAACIFLPPLAGTADNEEDPAYINPVKEEKALERRDKRAVVSMLKYAHTWRVFPLPIERASAMARMMLSESFFQLYKSGAKDYFNFHDRGLVSVGTYIPVFCIELACWLHEASFQAYYSPKAVEWNDWTPGKMNLNSIGLRLEAAILDETTNTQAYVATNVVDQVDGEEDSIVVVAFRGSVDTSNLLTDLKSRMVPLMDQLIGIDTAPFRVSKDGLSIEAEIDGWADSPSDQEESSHIVSCFSPRSSMFEEGCMPFPASSPKKRPPISAVTSGAMAVLSVAPVARDTIPCCHEGFQEVYAVIRKKVIESLLPVIQRQMAKAFNQRESTNKDATVHPEPLVLPKIYITGHSLGGSLAQLLALDLASNCELVIDTDPSGAYSNPEEELFQLPTPTSNTKPSSFQAGRSSTSPRSRASGKLALTPPIAVYTYGEPRVGNRAFSRLYKQRVPHTFRVATEGDPITAMPHVVCSGIYKHAGLEVVLDEGKTGNTLVGPTVVETLFRFHKVRTDFAAHSTDRYRDCLESALEQHELQEYYRGHSGTQDLEGGYGSMQATNNQDVPDWMIQNRASRHL